MATIAQLVVNVAADTAQLVKGMDTVQGQMTKVESSARAFGAAFGSMISISAITGAATHVGELASHIDDMAKKTGISAEAVQRLDFAARTSGSSFDTVSTAIVQMSKRLVGDDKSATNALNSLGLKIGDLKKMAPDQAFLTIADAIAKVPDPMKQSADAIALFGRGGAELIPTLKTNLKELGDEAPVMSDKLVKAGDAFDDNLVKLHGRIDVLRAQAMTPLLDLFDKLPTSVQTFGVAALAVSTPLGAMVSSFALIVGPGAIGTAMATFFTVTLPAAFTTVLPYLGPAGWIALAVIAVYEAWKHWDKIADIAKGVYTAVKTWLVDKFDAIVASVKAKVDAVTGFFGSMYDKVVGHSYVPDMINQIGAQFGRLDQVMAHPAQTAAAIVSGIFDNLGSQLQKKVAGMLSGIGGQFGSFLTSLSGSFLGGLGGLVASGVGALVNHFRGGEEGISVNPARDAWFAQHGGLEGVNQAAQAATGSVDLTKNIFDADTMAKFDAATSAWQQATSGGSAGIMAGDHNTSLPASSSWAGFAGGTHGEFIDFGRGTNVTLHGKERVMTEGERGSGAISIAFHINALDGASVRDAVKKPGGIADMIVDLVKFDKRGVGTRLARALA